jgi:hypothetical protein
VFSKLFIHMTLVVGSVCSIGGLHGPPHFGKRESVCCLSPTRVSVSASLISRAAFCIHSRPLGVSDSLSRLPSSHLGPPQLCCDGTSGSFSFS